MTDSQKLLAEYDKSGSESAFCELVTHYFGLVYSTALRLVAGDTHLAEDVAQTVFSDLARKAHGLSSEVMLGGWLHQHTYNVAAPIMRAQRRRQSREREAAQMNALQDDPGADLAQIAPVLDEAIMSLGTEDRTAIMLCFFERRDFRSIGQALGSSEDAARMRVTRALDKLHTLLTHRGVTLSATALGTALATEAVTAAPAGLAGSVAGLALASVASGTGFSATLYKLAAMTKVQAGAIGAIVLLGVAASVVVQHQAQAALGAQDESLRPQSAELARQQAENERLAGLVQARGSRANTLDELISIRSEVEALRQQTNSLAASMEKNRRLRGPNAQHADGSRSILETREEDRKLGIARLNYTKRWLLAFRMFADDNGNQFPTNFDEARRYFGEEAAAETNLTTGQFEIVYRGPATNITSPSLVVVLRERQPFRAYDGGWFRAHGFADGHSEVTYSADGNFDAWEKQHIIMAPPGR